PWKRHLLHLGTQCPRREISLRLAMPEINRQLHLTKVPFTTQIGFSMAKTALIEFDISRSHRDPQPPHDAYQNHPKPCAFLHIFHNLSVLKIFLLVLTKH
ncbi:MAG: hypothetical protein KKH21_21830, partial [Gammaproteobacteria bacterium]|nr:hypothetical protein [Gammaproteobacteria bacterium]